MEVSVTSWFKETRGLTLNSRGLRPALMIRSLRWAPPGTGTGSARPLRKLLDPLGVHGFQWERTRPT